MTLRSCYFESKGSGLLLLHSPTGARTTAVNRPNGSSLQQLHASIAHQVIQQEEIDNWPQISKYLNANIIYDHQNVSHVTPNTAPVLRLHRSRFQRILLPSHFRDRSRLHTLPVPGHLGPGQTLYPGHQIPIPLYRRSCSRAGFSPILALYEPTNC